MDLRYLEPKSRIAAVAAAANHVFDPNLRAVLHEMNASLPSSPARARHLELVAAENPVFLLSGQQLGVFLGPLLTFYKALSLVQTARELEKESGRTVVPLFWLQSEDHDIDEVNSIQLMASDGTRQRLSLPLDGLSAPHTSVSEYRITTEIDSVYSKLSTLLGLADATPLSIFSRHYAPGARYSAAFRGLLAEIFQEDGLLLFDPQHLAISQLAQPVYERALNELDQITELLHTQTNKLLECGGAEQVHIRSGSPLFFLRKESSTGPRFRLLKDGNNFQFIGDSERISGADLRRLVREQPARFSTSALLRPIVQDSLLPSAGYVAGSSELNYFRQIEPLYPLFNLTRPLAIPRSSFLLLDAKTRRLINQLGLSPQQLFQPNLVQMVLNSQLPVDCRPDYLARELQTKVVGSITAAKARVGAVDAKMGTAFDRSEEKVGRAVSGVIDRYRKLVQERDRTMNERAEKLQLLIAPEQVPQERSYSFLAFWCKFGPALKQRLEQEFVPFDAETKLLEL